MEEHWGAAVHGVAKSRTRLSDFTFTFHFHALEKEMATHSSVLAWRIPGTVESVGLHRVGHDWSDLARMPALEKEMATPSSILAWRIPGTEEPGGLPSMGSHRVGHDWSNLAAAAAAAAAAVRIYMKLLEKRSMRISLWHRGRYKFLTDNTNHENKSLTIGFIKIKSFFSLKNI